MHKVLFLFFLSLTFISCDNSTEPNDSDSLKLILSADKTNGSAPLTVKFSGKIEGKSDGIVGQVPDYFFFSQIGMTVIPYSIPDTSQTLVSGWSSEKTYPVGEYKVVLLYQGTKDGNSFNILSDTLLIKAK